MKHRPTPVRGRKPVAKLPRPKPAAPEPPFRCLTHADSPTLPNGWVRTRGLAGRGLPELEMRGVPSLFDGLACTTLFGIGMSMIEGTALPPHGERIEREGGWIVCRTRPSEPFGHWAIDEILRGAAHVEVIGAGDLPFDAEIPLVLGELPENVRVLLRTQGPLAGWMRTEGYAARGAPELEARGVPEPLARTAVLLLAGLATLTAQGGVRHGEPFDLSPSGLPAQCVVLPAEPSGEPERDEVLGRAIHWTVRGVFDAPEVPG